MNLKIMDSGGVTLFVRKGERSRICQEFFKIGMTRDDYIEAMLARGNSKLASITLVHNIWTNLVTHKNMMDDDGSTLRNPTMRQYMEIGRAVKSYGNRYNKKTDKFV